ncbi:MAG: caspase family protein [Chitinispirillaceae bacterium]|nr:caspase family protein [Chitinispirillaceae bacterium]
MMQAPMITFLVVSTLSILFADRYALIVGQNKGGASVDDLRYAEADAGRFAQVLRDYAGVRPEDMRLILRPDSMLLMAAGDSLASRMNSLADPQRALLFFYYSGHADAEGLLLDSTHLEFGALRQILGRIPAGIRIAVIDACQSGVAVAFKGGKRAEPFFFSDQQRTRGEVWIASASVNERAQESATLKSSLFSFHFFTGLRGSADLSADKRVTVTEAYQYAYRKTLETSALTTGVLQHPVYRFNITGEGDIVLTDLAYRKGGIFVDGSCKGTFLILSRDYADVFADFYKDKGREIFIALGPGDYTIINARGGDDIGAFQFSVSGNTTVRCRAGWFRRSLLPYRGTGAGN